MSRSRPAVPREVRVAPGSPGRGLRSRWVGMRLAPGIARATTGVPDFPDLETTFARRVRAELRRTTQYIEVQPGPLRRAPRHTTDRKRSGRRVVVGPEDADRRRALLRPKVRKILAGQKRPKISVAVDVVVEELLATEENVKAFRVAETHSDSLDAEHRLAGGRKRVRAFRQRAAAKQNNKAAARRHALAMHQASLDRIRAGLAADDYRRSAEALAESALRLAAERLTVSTVARLLVAAGLLSGSVDADYPDKPQAADNLQKLLVAYKRRNR